MQANAFKRAAALVEPAKIVKTNMRLLPRKTQTALVVNSIISVSVSIAEVQSGLSAYILGSQLNDKMLADTKENMGPVFQHLFALAKTLKVKLPGAGKKMTLKGETYTECLLRLHEDSSTLLAFVSELLDGKGLTEKYDIDPEVVAGLQELVSRLILAAYAFTYSVLKVTPSDVLDAQYQALVEQYGEEVFAKPVKAEDPQ